MTQSNNEKLDRLVGRMGPKAQDVFFNDLYPQVLSGRYPSLLNELWRLDYRRKPVGIRTFLLEPEYLGDGVGKAIYPAIIHDLQELFDGEYAEVLLAGGIGWGKSKMAEIGIAYEIYLLSCLRDPASSYGLMPGSPLAFLNVSVRLTQAKRVLFRGLFELIRGSPYFRKTFPYDPNIQSEIRFPSNVVCYPVAASEQAVLGEGVFSAAFDEMNFMAVVESSKQQPEGGTYDQATALYNRLSRRIRSRMNQCGRFPGHLWLISSARYPNDFTERKEIEAQNNPSIFVRKYPTWGTRPRHHFLPSNFRVEIGDQTKRSRVLRSTETDANLGRVVEVPMDFREEFEKDPDGAVRDYAGVSLLTIRPFITNRQALRKMFELGADLSHPYSALDVTLQSANDRLIPENLHWVDVSRKDARQRPVLDQRTGQPIVDRKLYPVLRFAHVDLAKTKDACGVAIVHVLGTKQIVRGIGPDARTESRPLIRVELLLRVVAPPQGEILAPMVRGIFYALAKLGMQFGKITYDSWGSLESIQIFQSQGYSADTLSVDAKTEQYETLKTAIYDERVLCYHVPKLEQELASLKLDEKQGKVDHPPHGSKDLADALCGAVWNAEQGFQVATAEAMAPRLGRVSGSEADIWDRFNRGDVISEEEFDQL